AVEPRIRTRPEAVRPAQPRTQVADAEPAQQAHRVIQPVILEVEPLADPELRRVPGEARERDLRTTVLAHEPHVEVTVVGGAFGLAMACGGRPRAGQVVQAVPVDPWHTADQQLRGADQPERLHLLRAEARDPRSE